MNPIEQLNSYLRAVERRLRALALWRGAALTAIAALAFTLVMVTLMNRSGFAAGMTLAARTVVFLAVGAALCAGLLVPLIRLNRRETAKRMEQRFPEFQERLLTVTERSAQNDAFTVLVADDALNLARSARPAAVAATGRIAAFATSAATAIAILIWLGVAGPGWLGYGTSLLWAGPHSVGDHAFYDILVSPGNRTVRRRSDQLIVAHLSGFDGAPRLWARYRGTSKWEQAPMQPQPSGNGYELLFAGLTDQVDYYVSAGPVHSRLYTLRVVDLPSVVKLRVRYHYPAVYGLPDSVEDPGGDLRAVTGTEAEVEILTDQPLRSGRIALDDNSEIKLEPKDGNWLAGRVPIQRDGTYHIAALDNGEPVRLSDDYFIEAKKDNPPQVRITRPGRDTRVSPIEEVPIAVSANDDFALDAVNLHYSVNGGPEKTIAIGNAIGAKQADGSTTLYLEDFHLVPGDLVSVYASARDALHTAKTDIFFIQAEPFERNYTQQQSSGGMGQDQQDNHPSEHQKEVIAATWNALKGPQDGHTESEQSKFISGVENKLSAQARTLAQRMRSRELAGTNDQFKTFSQEMDDAAAEMDKAGEQLRNGRWTNALQPEQKGLQHLLRAEAVFKDIQVAFGSSGGGGGHSAGRDLANMFDLELDTQKNQYETGEQASSNQRDKAVDEMMQKLADLARRQQELAAQQRNQQTFQQRWQQEMLRREAEELKREMEQQLSRNGQQQQQQQQSGAQSQQQQQGGSQSQQQQQQASRSGGSPSSSGGSAGQSALEQTIQQLSRAMDDMRQGATEQGSAGQRRAAERLQDAREMMRDLQRRQTEQQLQQLADRAEQLSRDQQDSSARLRQAFPPAAGAGDDDSQLGPMPPGMRRRSRRFESPEQGSDGSGAQTDAKASALARDKEALARSADQLEKDISAAAQGTAGGLPQTSSKLRDALGQAQQDEIIASMKKSAEFVRKGFGSYAWGPDARATMGMRNLQEKLKAVQQAFQQEQQAAKNQNGSGPGDKQDAQRQLAQVEQLRRRAEEMSGQAGGQNPSRSAGSGRSGSGAPVIGGPASADEEYRAMLRDLAQIRDALRGTGAQQDTEDLMNRLATMSPPRSDTELDRRIQQTVLPGIERVELQLRRNLEASGQPREVGGERVPADYSDALAEYFRRLSQTK